MLRLDRDNTGAVGNQVAFRHSASGTLTETGSINCVSTANAATGELRFATKASGGSNAERMRISSNGDVRVGGGVPATFGSGTTILETYNASTYTANLVTSGTHQLQMIASQTHGATSIGTRSNHNLNLSVNDSTKMTITTGGIVNISSTGNDLTQTGYRFQLTGSGGGEAASMAIKNEGSHPAKLHLMSGHGNWSVGNSVTIGDALEFRDESGAGTRMYIDSAGNAIFNHRVGINFANPGARFVVSQNANQLEPMRIRDANNTNAVTHYIGFRKADSEKGSIKGDRGGTSFNTTSDYRLKQNVTSISDGITRIKQLLPKKFSFIEDETNTLRDGFLAHEVSSLVPEAVDGTKDAVDSDNKPIHQQIDHSKLVPLLTAALQEEIAKRESLEARVAALEG